MLKIFRRKKTLKVKDRDKMMTDLIRPLYLLDSGKDLLGLAMKTTNERTKESQLNSAMFMLEEGRKELAKWEHNYLYQK